MHYYALSQFEVMFRQRSHVHVHALEGGAGNKATVQTLQSLNHRRCNMKWHSRTHSHDIVLITYNVS